MEDRKITELLTQAGNSIQKIFKNINAIYEYFGLKNKVLWESTTSWASGAKTIPSLRDYNTIQAWVSLGNSSLLMTRRGDKFVGGTPVGYPAWHATFYAELTIDGDTATMSGAYLSHNKSSNHGDIKSAGIVKIIGIDPAIPKGLQNVIERGGGALLLSKFKRWCEV